MRFAVLPTGAADQIRNWAESLDSARDHPNPAFLLEMARVMRTPIPNEPSFQPKAASVADNGVAEKTSEPKLLGSTTGGTDARSRS